MKCYSHTTRGIRIADNALDLLKTKVILTDSLLRAPHATFVDRLVFADVEVVDDKIFLKAQASDEDNRALVFYSTSMGTSCDDDDELSYEMDLNGVEVPFLKREQEYGGWGFNYDNQRMVLVMEVGGHARIKVKRIHTSTVGFWAGLFGAKPVTTEMLTRIEVRYDGNEVTTDTVLEQTREIVRLAPAAGATTRELLA